MGESHGLREQGGEWGGHEWDAWNAPEAGDCGIAEVCQDFWLFSRADGGLSFAYHLFSSL